MNVYDFDYTIYQGDSTIDFWIYCILKNPAVLRAFPKALGEWIGFQLGCVSREGFKQAFYRFFKYLPDTEAMVKGFWEMGFQRVAPWYLERRQPEDLVITASPDVLISEICIRLGVRYIASPVDPASGDLLGPNCRGREKVRRFQMEYPEESIQDFFSDSLTDSPLAARAATAYLVRKGRLRPWPGQNRLHIEGDEGL